MKKRVNEWLRFAKLDLDSAVKLIENPLLTQSSAFHCQQSIEKSFKALLENRIGKSPRIHDLERLKGLLEESNIFLDIDEDVLDEINDVYIDSRYPSDIGLIPEGIPSLETIHLFIELALTIYSQSETIINVL